MRDPASIHPHLRGVFSKGRPSQHQSVGGRGGAFQKYAGIRDLVLAISINLQGVSEPLCKRSQQPGDDGSPFSSICTASDHFNLLFFKIYF